MLALQFGYIDSEQFTVACAAWSAAKERPLAEALIDRGWLTDEQLAEIERLVADKIDKLGLDTDKTSPLDATVDSRNVEKTVRQGDIEKTVDSTSHRAAKSPSSRDRLDATTEIEAPSNADSVESQDTQGYGPGDAGYVQIDTMQWEPENERTRYTFTRMHGEGGIGRVWLAHDQHLNRQVALKEIRPDREQSKAAWSRFVREAQITSQLEHPNIVPVYELSNRGDDQGSFYTMRFVRGDTLRHAIDRYHEHRRDGTATEMELRSLLNSFVLVCHAIGYAHSRGVLHRDLKPSNIMLGAFGEVVVLDWGLAKMIHHDDDDDEDLMEAGPIAVTAEGAIDATQQGAILGTLPYMAPEQAAGRLDKVDTRTDIYGLGAILYATLTGNHPHKGTTTREVRSRIIKEPTPRVRAEDSSAHRVLDAICGKAMAKKRAGRYTKAGELAEDVQRWLADEPVSCFRESTTARAARWLRTHRTWAKAIAGSVLVVMLVSVVAAIFIDQARRGEERAKADATARFQESRETVDKMVTGVNDNLKEFPSMQPLRLRLLEQAAEKYKSYAEDDGADGPVKLEAARSLIRLADIYLEVGKDTDAETAYGTAKTRLLNIETEKTGFAEAQFELANVWSKLGLFYARHDKEEALACYGRAQTVLAELITGGDGDGTYEHTSAGVLVNQASLLNATDEEQAGIKLLEEAIEKLQRLVGEHADDRFVDGLATAQTNLGNVLQKLGRNSEAVPLLETAVESFKQLSAEHLDSAQYLEHAAAARLNLAVALSTLGRDADEQ